MVEKDAASKGEDLLSLANKEFLRACEAMRVYKSILSPSFLPSFLSSGHLVEYSTKEAREALEPRFLRPLSSILRSGVTSEATSDLRGHFVNNSCSSEKCYICKLISNAPYAYILLPCSPQILQGHCPLVGLQFSLGCMGLTFQHFLSFRSLF